MNLWNHIDPDYVLQIVKQGEMCKEIEKER